jgi:pyruvate dehydrogenase E2 component (dihydrolipoamide acetyltransferase)
VPYDVKMPDIGEGIAEGEIVRWLVKAGDEVREDQPLVEVMTDKASVEIPSPRTGVIAALHAAEGQVVPVGSVIISIAVAGEQAASAAPTATAAAPAAAPARAPAAPFAGAGRVQASPAVRQLAKQLGVALERVTGTGPGGAITAEDLRSSAGTVSPPAAGAPATAHAQDEERIPLRGLRRKIAEHMRRSLSTAAQFTFVAECDFTGLVAHRAALRTRAEAAAVKLTFLPYIIKALVEPLRQFPYLNSSLDDERHEIVLKKSFHIGIATATPDGLTVPVIHDAGRLPLIALAREIERLSSAARDHTLVLEELQGATFTITSTGARGGVLATPILHHPQVAILGVHEVKKRPAVVDDRIVIRELGNLSLSLDHRVVDGAVGADFLYALIARLEKPESWLTQGDLA